MPSSHSKKVTQQAVSSTTSAPPTTPSTVVTATAPPALVLPPLQGDTASTPLSDFRGAHPKAGQVAAIPGVTAELSSSTAYSSTFGPAAPELGPFVVTLTNALGWTEQRISVETYLIDVKTQEGLAWKSALAQIDQLKAAYDVIVARSPAVATQFPALARLLDVNSTIAQKAAVTRKKGKATKAAAAATAAVASAPGSAPVAASATATPVTAGQGGGGGH